MKIAEILRSKLVAQINDLVDSNRGLLLLSEYLVEIAELKRGTSEKIFKRVVPYVLEYGDIKISALTELWYEGFKAYLLLLSRLNICCLNSNTYLKHLLIF